MIVDAPLRMAEGRVKEMSTKFYFRGLTVSNFRAFSKLEIEKFRRINIIGGFNAVGKTALLEILFLVLDRRNAASAINPAMWRRFEGGAIDLQQFFHNTLEPKASISITTREGRDEMLLSYDLPPSNVQLTIPMELDGFNRGQSQSNQKGLRIRTQSSGSPTADASFLIAGPNGVVGTTYEIGKETIPVGVILGAASRGSGKETAQRLTFVIKERRLPELLSMLRLIEPDITSLQILQSGDLPIIHVVRASGDLIPTYLLGDGFQNLLTATLAIMNARDGVVFLDEIDAAIHFSIISKVWSTIAKVALANNCQIFATSHSRECIDSAAKGIKAAGREDDFQYLRLDRIGDSHNVTSYSMSELGSASEFGIEIR